MEEDDPDGIEVEEEEEGKHFLDKQPAHYLPPKLPPLYSASLSSVKQQLDQQSRLSTCCTSQSGNAGPPSIILLFLRSRIGLAP